MHRSNFYKIFISYFKFLKNSGELFNFSINISNFNNYNGITYIKGILGISILLHFFGLTFFILSNLQTKILGAYHFYETIYNPFYFISFIGLRYSPRIIFSCSGYTLVHKFLSFIEREENFYFIKFLFLQSYKYILLILMSLFIRYSFYYLDIIFRSIKNPILYLSRYNLERDNSYFFDLFTFLFYELKEFTSLNTDKSIICFLYLPLNEIFLFIIGIGIVSIGYKFKLRIDLIIIVLAVFIYLVKSIISILFSDELEIYSTLFFLLFGYGVLMLNPIFNLCHYYNLRSIKV